MLIEEEAYSRGSSPDGCGREVRRVEEKRFVELASLHSYQLRSRRTPRNCHAPYDRRGKEDGEGEGRKHAGEER